MKKMLNIFTQFWVQNFYASAYFVKEILRLSLAVAMGWSVARKGVSMYVNLVSERTILELMEVFLFVLSFEESFKSDFVPTKRTGVCGQWCVISGIH